MNDVRATRAPAARRSRRDVLKAGAALVGSGTLGFPAVLRGQSDAIRIGHLTPLTGFLGALGHYAVMGVNLALEEINRGGGILGRPVELIAEDSQNPTVAAAKARRLFERDAVTLLLGEISSASALTISRAAARAKRVFVSTAARSDALRGARCNRYTFHLDTSTTANVKGVGGALLRDGMITGKRQFTLTADYVFGHDLLKAAKNFLRANGGDLVGDELVATDVVDFSPYLRAIQRARPDVVCSNLAGQQVTTFLEQYAAFGLDVPVVGFNLNTNDAWAAGHENFGGIWPLVWHHDVNTSSARAFVDAFGRAYGKPPEHHAWTDYLGLKIAAQALNSANSLDPERLIAFLEQGTEFDILKGRKGYFRAWDHQLMQEQYTVTVKPAAEVTNRWDILALGPPVPGPGRPLESVATTREENPCVM